MSPRDLIADSRVLWQMLRGQSRVGTAAERLQAFYAPQATRYDAFRARLLHGRAELIDRLTTPQGGTVVELGGGTGSNIDRFGRRMQRLRRYTLVDLCPALLEQARSRARVHRNVELVEGERVVQAWRVAGWDPGVYSLTRFELDVSEHGTRLGFDHTGFPPESHDDLDSGWHSMYWEPMRAHLQAG